MGTFKARQSSGLAAKHLLYLQTSTVLDWHDTSLMAFGSEQCWWSILSAVLRQGMALF